MCSDDEACSNSDGGASKSDEQYCIAPGNDDENACAAALAEETAPVLRRTGRVRNMGTGGAGLLPSADPHLNALLAPLGLGYTCGCNAAEAGGKEGSKLLSSSFASLDASVLELTGHYKGSERVVLLKDGIVVAAANVQLHREYHVLEVPIFAAAKTARGKGYGSVLAALLLGLGRKLGMRTLVVSATDESRAFWVKQGLHTSSFCAAAEKTALRSLRARGVVRAFANSILMGMPIVAASSTGADDTFAELRRALDRAGADRGAGLNFRKAATVLSYIDVTETTGNFWLAADGTRIPVSYEPHEQLPEAFEWVSYSRLEAFYGVDGPERGWGLRCTKEIREGQFVVELVGRCLSEEEHQGLEDETYAVGFPDNVLAAKRKAGDQLHYIDPKEYGGLWRFVNDSQEAPNTTLVYWPPFEQPSSANPMGVLPKRAFLVAAHDIPAGVELTFDYGR